MRPFRASEADGTARTCARLAHLWRFSAKAMAGNEGKCVPVAHMLRLPASCSRTCVGFRPEMRPGAGKQGEVREPAVEKRQEAGGCACEMPGNRGRCARTSAGFVPYGRKVGRNSGQVRESAARTQGMCARAAHMRPFRDNAMAGNAGMCVRAAHMGPFRASERYIPAALMAAHASRSCSGGMTSAMRT